MYLQIIMSNFKRQYFSIPKKIKSWKIFINLPESSQAMQNKTGT